MARSRTDEVSQREVDDAVGIIKRAYYNDVNDWAEEFDRRIEDGEFEDRDAFFETLDQEVDGAQRVIYTYQAMLGVISSDNDEAAWEEGMEDSLDWSGSIPWSQIMYFAFKRDIIEAMNSDIDDDATFDEEDDEDDED